MTEPAGDGPAVVTSVERKFRFIYLFVIKSNMSNSSCNDDGEDYHDYEGTMITQNVFCYV